MLDIASRPEFIAVTVGRVAVALLISFVLGMALAMAMYWWHLLERYLMPLIRLLMAVPVLCWILFAVLWFKVREVRQLHKDRKVSKCAEYKERHVWLR